MNLSEAQRWAYPSMLSIGISEARLESGILISHVTGLPRSQVYAFQERQLTTSEEYQFCSLVERRKKREPLAYILGEKEFFGLQFMVSSEVMIPRPETELLVELGLMLLREREPVPAGNPVLADVGTGSGCVAIALACNFEQAQLHATDISMRALSVASENCHRHRVQDRIHLTIGNLLESIPEQIDIICANPPYLEIQDLLSLQPEVQWEPLIALDGGLRGTEVIERLLQQSQHKLAPGGSILIELDPWQVVQVKDMASMIFPVSAIWMERDLSGAERVLVIRTM